LTCFSSTDEFARIRQRSAARNVAVCLCEQARGQRAGVMCVCVLCVCACACLRACVCCVCVCARERERERERARERASESDSEREREFANTRIQGSRKASHCYCRAYFTKICLCYKSEREYISISVYLPKCIIYTHDIYTHAHTHSHMHIESM
jgi:hypothetical protein